MTDTLAMRCPWCTSDALYQRYHDTEWGVASYDPKYLFEMLILEGFQAGLSWLTVLRKRQHLRHVLYDFQPDRLAVLSDHKIQQLLQDPGIIRHQGKLHAARHNARMWLQLGDPVDLIWSVAPQGKPLVGHYQNSDDVPNTSVQSEALSRSLKQAGFKFVGPTICQAFLQACGVRMDHLSSCFRYKQLAGGLDTHHREEL